MRWPVWLATALADEAEVIAEGLNGRTATIERPVAEGRNGLPHLVPCLRSHAPVDLLVIYLGTNDAYWLEPIMVRPLDRRLVKVARAAEAGPGGSAPDVLVVCPPPFGGHELASAFREGNRATSRSRPQSRHASVRCSLDPPRLSRSDCSCGG